MYRKRNYFQHPERVIQSTKDIPHVMALSLNPLSGYKTGIIRCIINRDGHVNIPGYVDRSSLYVINCESFTKFELGTKLNIANSQSIIASLIGDDGDVLGLEDPDIWPDEKTNLIHVYFTIPTKSNTENGYRINLGHAVGPDLNSLEMTEPAITAPDIYTAVKEVSIAPVNSKGVRLNLVESSHIGTKWDYSTIRIAIAKDMYKPWELGDTIFNPESTKISWIKGHASPGPLLPRSFIDIGDKRLVGIINGRSSNKKINGNTVYGKFRIGLFIYNYEDGIIEWISPKPLINDSEATTITFASQFMQTDDKKGILYAHVDDSFVRAYTMDGDKIKALIPQFT